MHLPEYQLQHSSFSHHTYCTLVRVPGFHIQLRVIHRHRSWPTQEKRKRRVPWEQPNTPSSQNAMPLQWNQPSRQHPDRFSLIVTCSSKLKVMKLHSVQPRHVLQSTRPSICPVHPFVPSIHLPRPSISSLEAPTLCSEGIVTVHTSHHHQKL